MPDLLKKPGFVHNKSNQQKKILKTNNYKLNCLNFQIIFVDFNLINNYYTSKLAAIILYTIWL